MKNRKLKLVANVAGFDTLIAEVKIQNYASEADVKEWTDLVCPECNEKPKYTGSYVCDGTKGFEVKHELKTFNHWSKLKRVIKGTVQALSIPRLLKDKEEAVAKLSYLTSEAFAKEYVDATRKDEGEKGVVLVDNAGAKNLFKLLVAVEQLKYVIIAKWNDTTEEIVGLLTVSASGRILIREIIPSNLVQVKDTLFLDRNAITNEEVEEAKGFIQHFIPLATKATFEVHDYRAQWKAGQVNSGVVVKEPQKVADIKEIMKQIVVTVPPAKPKAKKKAK